MSFSSDAKTEICRGQINRKCCALSEAYGALSYGNTFHSREIKLVTENRDFSARMIKLMQKAFAVDFDEIDSGKKQILSIRNGDKITRILSAYGFELDRFIAHNINHSVLEEDCCRISFLRGVFLAGGSVTDPEKGYHMELSCPHYNVNRGVYAILLDMGFFPKDTERNGNYVIYFKHSEAIEDLLTMLGAPVSAMKLMSAKIEKDMRNSVNRQVNCDTANVDKTLEAARLQLAAIQRIEKTNVLTKLPEKLFEAARLRTDNPEASILELAEMAEPPVTKSCMNHRLRKLMEFAETARK